MLHFNIAVKPILLLVQPNSVRSSVRSSVVDMKSSWKICIIFMMDES